MIGFERVTLLMRSGDGRRGDVAYEHASDVGLAPANDNVDPLLEAHAIAAHAARAVLTNRVFVDAPA